VPLLSLVSGNRIASGLNSSVNVLVGYRMMDLSRGEEDILRLFPYSTKPGQG
jgi:hypothetical protein